MAKKKAAKKAAKKTAKRAAPAPAPLDIHAIRKGLWVEWSGRQVKTLNEQAARYGLPIGAATIDLPAVVRWLHDFLAENARRLSRPESEDPEYEGAESPGLEKQRAIKAQLLEIQLQRELGAYLRREEVHAGLATFAAILRAAGEKIQRQPGGSACYEILDDALVNATGALDRLLGGTDDDAPDDAG